MEIERKYLVQNVPDPYLAYPFSQIEQGYLCTEPVVRVRRDGDAYYLTYKGRGLLAREEYNLPLTEDGHLHLLKKADGNVLTKKRYLIPLSGCLKAELDIFEGKFDGLTLVEVEFPDEETARAFCAPEWFGKEVTFSNAYHNSVLSTLDTWDAGTYCSS